MVMKLQTTQTDDELIIERIMYTRRYALILDKERCVGCDICHNVCPREAIEILKPKKIVGEKLKKPTISIDDNKCSFCGICNAICPYGALSLTINGKKHIPVYEKESFPKLVHTIIVDDTRCPKDCNECEDICPFNLISITADKSENSVKVEIDKDHCPCCRLCEVKCPEDTIQVRKIINGSIKINQNSCPEACRDCFDVCPIPGVLNINDDGRIEVNAQYCVFCGVCKVVCPVDEALCLKRSSLLHTTVHSGAWNKALENLTSTQEMTRELRAKSSLKIMDSASRRVG